MLSYPDQFARNITPLKRCYLIFGDDPWLCETTKSALYTQAKKEGFAEKIRLTQDSGFNWNQLVEQWQSMSLFSTRRIIELTLPQGKPGRDGSAELQALMQSDDPDTLLVLTGPKLTKAQTGAKWFKALDAKGVYVPCATPEGQQFQRWLKNRIQHSALHLTQDAEQMLGELYEGNLLAADQALQLLKLLSPNDIINAQQLEQYFEDQSRFSVFQLSDELLNNRQTKAQHILAQLQAEGVAITILLWSQFKELAVLLQLKQAQQQGDNLATMWRQLRIWDKRKTLYLNTLSRLTIENIETMLACASKIELRLKQQGIEDWTALSHLCLLYDPSAHTHLRHIEIQ